MWDAGFLIVGGVSALDEGFATVAGGKADEADGDHDHYQGEKPVIVGTVEERASVCGLEDLESPVNASSEGIAHGDAGEEHAHDE